MDDLELGDKMMHLVGIETNDHSGLEEAVTDDERLGTEKTLF